MSGANAGFMLIAGYFSARALGDRVDFMINKLGEHGAAQTWIDYKVLQEAAQ